jgi:SAM-dependent methyltransferase
LQSAAFDGLAGAYDADFTDTPVGRTLREIVWRRLTAVFGESQRVLELGCGTGEDAVWLARQGIRVVATDASQGMVQAAREKARTRACSDRVEFHCLAAHEIGALDHRRPFDGVFSNFGAINCVPDLAELSARLAGMLTPGAPLMWVIMGRHVPWEWLWYLARGAPRKAFRRLNRAGVEWRGMRISYPTPAAMSSWLEPHFEVTRVAPLGYLLPPSYAAGWLNRSPRMLAVLARAEGWGRDAAALAALSDHYILEARRAAT